MKVHSRSVEKLKKSKKSKRLQASKCQNKAIFNCEEMVASDCIGLGHRW